MENLREDIKRYGAGGKIFLASLTVIASVLLGKSVWAVLTGSYEHLITCSLLALIITVTSAKHPLVFFGNRTGISVSEGLIFLAVITMSPYHGALLSGVDMIVANRRLKLKPSHYLLNTSNIIISVFISGKIYFLIADYLSTHVVAGGTGEKLLGFALPLLALALTDYALQFTTVITWSYLTRVVRVWDRLRDTWPWEPIAFMVGATIAGVISYAFREHGLLATGVTLLLVLPVPIIIYYSFRTYRDKLSGQEKHYQELTSVYDSILEMLAMAIDAKDDVTHDHIQRVKLFAGRMGEMVGLSNIEIEALKAGSLLHDIGKIGVPAYILNKPGKLTQHEFEQMKMHTIIGADMLSNVNFRYPVVPIVRHHHERWDGRGYPDGLKGEKIPITARILTLVDNYDALRSDRPYKKGMTREEALEYIKQNAGTFFDPNLVEMFLATVDQLEAEASASSFKPPESKKRSTTQSAAMALGQPGCGAASRASDRPRGGGAQFDSRNQSASYCPLRDVAHARQHNICRRHCSHSCEPTRQASSLHHVRHLVVRRVTVRIRDRARAGPPRGPIPSPPSACRSRNHRLRHNEPARYVQHQARARPGIPGS